MKNNKKFGILVIIALLSLSNSVMADDFVDYGLTQDNAFEKIKANKNSIIKAQEAMSAKDYQTAITLLSHYINEKPKKYEVYKLRGDAYYAIRRYDLAQEDYQTAVDLKTSDDKFITNTKYVSAIVLGADKNEQLQNAELGDLYRALMYAQKAQNDPAYSTSYENAQKYNSHIYLPQPNKNDINKINCPQKYGKIVNPQGIDAKIYGAVNDIENNNYNEAIYKLQSVISEYPNYYLGHYLMGVALSELEKDDDAIKSFEKALSLNPYDFESYASLGRIYYSKAETTFSSADSEKSINYFNKAIALNKNCPTYYFYIGMNQLQIGNTNIAISNFNKAMSINPSDYNSMYYKNIAQYINGDYDDVVDGTTKLIYKHVSNNNSVLYLRALAYTKLNNIDKALQDLDSIENNIEDIYNIDLKQTSAREKSLLSYVHYLKSEIQHSKGAGAAADNSQAYLNPIINRLANAKKAIEPYEKSLQGDSISLNDYKKFENFYSTSLPKLLESGAIITYDDIDNQYDYIRTTFCDIGVSFVYLNPDYKITTIKDYPYKKYSAKLSGTDSNLLPARSLSDTQNVEMAKTQFEKMRVATPQSELLAQTGQQSIAQMLALNELANKKNKEPQSAQQLKPITSQIGNISFKSEVPDAERVETSKNIASGEIYESKNFLLNADNNKNVQNILEEEKNMNNIPVLRPKETGVNLEPSKDGNIKISANNPLPVENNLTNFQEQAQKSQKSIIEPLKFSAEEVKQTDDLIIKYKDVKPVTEIVTSNAIASTASNTANVLSITAETVKNESAKQLNNQNEIAKQLKEQEKKAQRLAKIEAKEQLKIQKEAAKQLKTETKNKLKETQEAQKREKIEFAKQALAQQQESARIAKEELKAAKQAEKESAKQLKTQEKAAKKLKIQDKFAKQAEKEKNDAEQKVAGKAKTIKSSQKKIQESAQNINETLKKNSQVDVAISDATKQVVEKHANIISETNETQSSQEFAVVDDSNDIVELDTNIRSKKIAPDSDLFTKDTVFTKPNSQITYIHQQSSMSKESVIVPNENVQVPNENVQVPNETTPLPEPVNNEDDLVISEANISQINIPEINIPQEQVQIKAEENTYDDFLSSNTEFTPIDELSEQKEVNKSYISEKLSEILSEVVPKSSIKSAPVNEETIEQTLKDVDNLKEQRRKLKNESKLLKKQQKAESKKLKENYKLQKQNYKNSKSVLEDKYAKEQSKVLQATDEIKIQHLRARLAKENRVLSKEEQSQLKAQYQADKEAAEKAYRARQAEKKAALKSQKELEKSKIKASKAASKNDNNSGSKNIFSKIKFWKKNK